MKDNQSNVVAPGVANQITGHSLDTPLLMSKLGLMPIPKWGSKKIPLTDISVVINMCDKGV